MIILYCGPTTTTSHVEAAAIRTRIADEEGLKLDLGAEEKAA